MAHSEQQEFCKKIKEQFPEYFINKKVLDIGSLDINGNNRFLFTNCDYIGLDVSEGNNVDVVSIGHLYDGPDEYFDTIISTEVFEHDMFYEETVKNIIRMLKPGGAFIFTCAADGRPEHGTRKFSEFCSPLLTKISEEWADYYKNLMEKDFLEINEFKQNFSDGIFIFNDKASIPSDLYFFGVKGGIKKSQMYTLKNVNSMINSEEYKDDIFVVDTWPDTDEKEKDLIQCIQKLKEFSPIPILLVSHYPIKPEIQKMVDYYLFDKDNPLLNYDEYDTYQLTSGIWVNNGIFKLNTKNIFQHDYAIWTMMQKAFKFCDMLGKKTIHFMEYDNIVDTFQYRQAFLEKSHNHDAVVYEYHEKSSSNSSHSEYIATYIFSIKTDIALKTIFGVNSKWEYFHGRPEGFQLERSFLRELKKHTDNIHITPYIANNDELNTQAVWNRDGILRDDAAFQIYLGVDDFDDLYLCLISGFFDYKPTENYLLEYRYGDINKFDTLHQNEYKFINLGKYKRGKTVYMNYLGKEVFKEFLHMPAETYRKINNISIMNEQVREQKINENNIQKNTIHYNFIDGPYVEIKGNLNESYRVEMIEKDSGFLNFTTNIKNNSWAKGNKKYFTNWKLRVIDSYNNVDEHEFNLEDKNVLISFESFSLGDTIAWIPYIEEFRKKNNCNVFVSTPHKNMFETEYPNVVFVFPGVLVNDVYAKYNLGLFIDNDVYNLDKNKVLPNTIPLQKVATEILGLEYKEIKTKITKPKPFKSKKPYITIATHSTAQTKYWNNPTGWQELVDYVKSKGYDVYLLSKEEDGYMGNKNPEGVIQIQNKSLEEIGSLLLGSECFVGISSGLSWYAWALEVPSILISGFTDESLEMKSDVVRIINKDVCNGCWAKHMFDKGDWNWCPEHKGTERQFECSKTIEFNTVKPHLEKILKK